MYDPEALIQDADIELAEMAAVADAIAAGRARGICQHQHAQGPPEQLACRENTAGCQAVFTSTQQWYEAMDLAADGQARTAASAGGPERRTR
ncbi:hypothetical protein [uncultured Pseudonocardia sp.]|jgi:hypothetical protein|uniref:hypothetical protein n=1 Tax=uncultured Pseudonocardia sp. TaxID=211455 RepID=UPI00262102C5|nr:hypothetical protein [uncultured Pseudonocardia sp.]